MKRVILAMFAIFFIIGGIAAQEVKIGNGTLTIGGKISTGIEATFDDDTNDKGTVRMYNDTDGTNLRAELTTTYANENVGFTSRLRADDVEVGKAAAGFRYAYGWINLFDGLLRPVGGYLDVTSNVWGTKGDLDVDVGGAGLRLEVKPIEGLNFGAFLRLPDQLVKVNQTGGLHDPGKAANIEQFLRYTALGAAYDQSAFYVRLQYVIDTAPFEIKAGTTEDPDPNGQLDFGIGFTGLPGLGASVEGRIQQLDDFAATGEADFRETVSYTISDALPLTIGVNGKELLHATDKDLDPYIQLNPWVSYAVSDALSVGLGGGYGFGHNAGTDLESMIYVKPNLSYSFGKGLATKLWYVFEIDKVKNVDDAVNKNTIQLEFVWSF
jgi:hypothetical protein